MSDYKTAIYKFWNGENADGSSAAGDQNLIAEGPRAGKTDAKYQVASDTVSADNLQEKPR